MKTPPSDSLTPAGEYGKVAAPTRFYGLDAARGLAALIVVLFHWRHFFTVGDFHPMTDYFGYDLLRVFYANGVWAVDIFFCLSGFVFFFHYADRIRAKKISFGVFAWRRFARLYPLYIAAILLVIVLQTVLVRLGGEPFVYRLFDLKHLLLSLAAVSHWGFQEGMTFNGPDWSISIEVLLYIFFFLACRLGLCARIPYLLLLVFLGLILSVFYAPTGRGVVGFFMGGLVFEAYRRRDAVSAKGWILLAGLFFFGWFAVLNQSVNAGLHAVMAGMLGSITDFGGVARQQQIAHRILLFAMIVGLFPLTLFLLAASETYAGRFYAKLRVLGDTSYSTYLLHFPMQLVFVLIFRHLDLDNSMYLDGWVLFLFVIALLSVSYLSYHYLERPAQRALLRKTKNP